MHRPGSSKARRMSAGGARGSRVRYLGLGVAIATALVLVSSAPSAPATKLYSASVNSASVRAGETTTLTITITNSASITQSLGSANVAAPGELTPLGAPHITVRQGTLLRQLRLEQRYSAGSTRRYAHQRALWRASSAWRPLTTHVMRSREGSRRPLCPDDAATGWLGVLSSAGPLRVFPDGRCRACAR